FAAPAPKAGASAIPPLARGPSSAGPVGDGRSEPGRAPDLVVDRRFGALALAPAGRALRALADLREARLEALVVGPEQPLRRGLGGTGQERPRDGQQQERPDASAVSLRLLRVGSEIAF